MEATSKQTQETTVISNANKELEIQTGSSLGVTPTMVSTKSTDVPQNQESKTDSAKDIQTSEEIPPNKDGKVLENGSDVEEAALFAGQIQQTETPQVQQTETSIKINGDTPRSEEIAPCPTKDEKVILKNNSDKSVQTSSTEATSGSYKKNKKKDNASAEEKKLVDLLVHVFDGLDTPEKKMEALAKKYIQLAADMKTTETKLEDVEGKHKEVKKEKDQIQSDFGKVNMARTKLESLCRELQKQNKIIKDEIQRRADEEDRKRKDLSQKFQTTINDITTQMGENHKRNQQLKQDNTDLAQKLKGLVEQYEVREQHIEKVLKAKQLELQLCEAKLQQQNLILQEERQNNLKEKHVLLQESLDQKKKVEMLVRQEAELKSQLALYTEKFVEFQSTLTKSNEVFATFKKEMDKMTKTIRKLEKESNMWKSRYENTNVSLLQMVEERTQKESEISTHKGKIDKLEKLCRALQLERRKLKKELEQNEKDNHPDAGSITLEASAQQPARNEKEDKPRDETPSPSSSPDVECTGGNGGEKIEIPSDASQEKHEPTADASTEERPSSTDKNENTNNDAGSTIPTEAASGLNEPSVINGPEQTQGQSTSDES